MVLPDVVGEGGDSVEAAMLDRVRRGLELFASTLVWKCEGTVQLIELNCELNYGMINRYFSVISSNIVLMTTDLCKLIWLLKPVPIRGWIVHCYDAYMKKQNCWWFFIFSVHFICSSMLKLCSWGLAGCITF